jgi:hypothetical protein
VGPETHELVRERPQSLRSALRRARLKKEVAALCVAELPEADEKWLYAHLAAVHKRG